MSDNQFIPPYLLNGRKVVAFPPCAHPDVRDTKSFNCLANCQWARFDQKGQMCGEGIGSDDCRRKQYNQCLGSCFTTRYRPLPPS